MKPINFIAEATSTLNYISDRQLYKEKWLLSTPFQKMGMCVGFVCYISMAIIIILSQQASFSLGNYYSGKTPNIIIAGLLQLILFVWIVPAAFEVLARVGIRLYANLDAYNPQPYLAFCLAAFVSFGLSAALIIYGGIFAYNEDEKNPQNLYNLHQVPFPPIILQFVISCLVVVVLVSPWVTPFWAQRKAILYGLAECFSCIFGYPVIGDGQVKFHHVLICDCLTSSTLMLWEMEYTVCHFATANWSNNLVCFSDDPPPLKLTIAEVVVCTLQL